MEKQRFTGKTRLFMLISAAIILIALVMSICGVGMNFGIDFVGGSLLTYEIGEDFDTAAVEQALIDAGINESQIAKAGTGNPQTQVQVRIKLVDNTDEKRADFEKNLKAAYPNAIAYDMQHVGAVAGKDLIRNAITSLLVAFACILIYIGIRFDFLSGLAAIVALVHDILIMCSFMVFFRGAYQVNSSFVAALLTIVGYSINNTIVIFDRIRETSKMQGYREGTRKAIVEYSVSSTISRTINTTVTTLLTLVTLYILGVASIKEFAFPLIVGMLAGTYSSVLISGQVWAMWDKKYHAAKAAKAEKKA